MDVNRIRGRWSLVDDGDAEASESCLCDLGMTVLVAKWGLTAATGPF